MKTQFSNLAIPNRILSSSKVRIKIQLPTFSGEKSEKRLGLPLFREPPKKSAGPTGQACTSLRLYPLAVIPLFHCHFIDKATGTDHVKSGSYRNTEVIAAILGNDLSANIVNRHIQRFNG